jgi:hypothetical protein
LSAPINMHPEQASVKWGVRMACAARMHMPGSSALVHMRTSG